MTPFRTMVVPPPLSAFYLQMSTPVTQVTFCHSGDSCNDVAILLCSGQIAIYTMSHGNQSYFVVSDSCTGFDFLQRGRIACNAERCISHGSSVRLYVRLSHDGTLSRWMKIGLSGLHYEVAKTLQFSDTNNGWGRRFLPPNFNLTLTPAPKCLGFPFNISAMATLSS